jgi:hypothetical protein
MHTRKDGRWWPKQNYHCLRVELDLARRSDLSTAADARPIVLIRCGCFRPHDARWRSGRSAFYSADTIHSRKIPEPPGSVRVHQCVQTESDRSRNARPNCSVSGKAHNLGIFLLPSTSAGRRCQGCGLSVMMRVLVAILRQSWKTRTFFAHLIGPVLRSHSRSNHSSPSYSGCRVTPRLSRSAQRVFFSAAIWNW